MTSPDNQLGEHIRRLVPVHDEALGARVLPVLLQTALVMLRAGAWENTSLRVRDMATLMDSVHNMPHFLAGRLGVVDHRMLLQSSVLPVLVAANAGSNILRNISDSWLETIAQCYGREVSQMLDTTARRDTSHIGD